MNKRGFNRVEAIAYLGVKTRFFEAEVRPHLTPTKMGTSLVFDRFDLDRVFDDIKRRNGRPAQETEVAQWAEPESRVSTGTKPTAGAPAGRRGTRHRAAGRRAAPSPL